MPSQPKLVVRANQTVHPVLNRSSPEPLYRQLACHLEQEILSGSLKRGDQLDSEALLANRFQVSRITLRQAVADLVRRRLLVRKQGKGTFVTSPAVRHDLRRSHGLLGSLFSQARDASARLLRYEFVVPSAETATSLNLELGEPALRLDRMYLVGGQPIALARAWLVPEVGKLARTTAKLMSTEDMLQQVGIAIVSSEVTMRAEVAGAVVGRALSISPRAPVLVLRRKALGGDGAVKELGTVWFCSDAYEFVSPTGRAGDPNVLFDIRTVPGKV